MLKMSWKSLLISPAILGTALVATSAQAAPDASGANANSDKVLIQIDNYANEGQTNSVDQVTSVSELRDVQPTEWAYEALKSLVERYGCIVGYPDRTFRGNRALSRWEFAAGLNACMNVMERLIQENVAVLREDIDKLKRLMQEFEAELAALGARVDNLEARTSFLEDHQFSTTTKLTGEVIIAPTGIFGTKKTLNNETNNNQFAMQDRVRLQFNTSFSGDDLLVTRLAAGSAARFKSFYPTNDILDPATGQPLGIVGDAYESPTFTQQFNLAPSTNNSVSVDWLAYYVPIDLGKDFRLNTYIAGWGGQWADFVPTLNPYFEDYDGGKGSLSEFSQRNPIYQIGGGGGIGASLQLGFLEGILGPSSLSFGYLAGNANSPLGGSNTTSQPNVNPLTGQNYTFSEGGQGLFNGNYAALAQLNANISDGINLAFTYVNAYSTPDSPIFNQGGSSGVGIVGTTAANLSRYQLNRSLEYGGIGAPPVSPSDYNGSGSVANTTNNMVNPFDFGGKQTNSYGVQAAIKFADWLNFSAFGSYTNVTLIGKDNGDIWTYGGGFAFPDLGKEGNILGIFAGVQPYISGLSNRVGSVYNLPVSNPFTAELFYKYQVTDNLSLTPGVIWISNPEQTTGETNGSVIGTLRGTFTF